MGQLARSSSVIIWPDEPIASLSQLQGAAALAFLAKIAAMGIDAQRLIFQQDPVRRGHCRSC